MRFENTILNLLVRYTKETGNYVPFKKRICESFTHESEKHIIKGLPFSCPLFFLWKIGIESNDANLKSTKYIYSIYKDEIDKLFKDFLTINCCGANFFKNIDYEFIKRVFYDAVKYRSKLDCLFKNISPYNFITNAFEWSNSAEGYNFWCNIDKMWKYCFFDFINSK